MPLDKRVLPMKHKLDRLSEKEDIFRKFNGIIRGKIRKSTNLYIFKYLCRRILVHHIKYM